MSDTFATFVIGQVVSFREHSLVSFFGTFHLKLIWICSVSWKRMDEMRNMSWDINMNSVLLPPRSRSQHLSWVHIFIHLLQAFTHTSLLPQSPHTPPHCSSYVIRQLNFYRLDLPHYIKSNLKWNLWPIYLHVWAWHEANSPGLFVFEYNRAWTVLAILYFLEWDVIVSK